MSRNVLRLVVDGSNTLGKKESYKIKKSHNNQRWRWIHSLGEGLPAQKRANYVRMNRFCESCGLEDSEISKMAGIPSTAAAHPQKDIRSVCSQSTTAKQENLLKTSRSITIQTIQKKHSFHQFIIDFAAEP